MAHFAEFRIGNKTIGWKNPVFVIADVGINHNGRLEYAKAHVDAAVDAGIDCIKFQTHIVDKEMIKTDMKPADISDESLWDIMDKCSLTKAEEKELKEYCDKKGILFLSTPFSREAADRLEELGVLAYKIGSGEITNRPMLKHIAKFGKPMIISKGMTTFDETEATLNVLKEFNIPIALLQCTSAYPSQYKDVKLGNIKLLKEKFNIPIGLSDHSVGIYTALGAVALGAKIIEKHFTISRLSPGPDQVVSLEPHEFKEMIKGIRAIEAAAGSDTGILKAEIGVKEFARECVVSIKDIKKGSVLSMENIWVKRPGDGEIPANDIDKVLGKKARHDIVSGVQLKWADVE